MFFHNNKRKKKYQQKRQKKLIIKKVNKAVQPRPTGSASIPGLLQLFQNEWDASVLETFTLKKQLDAVSFFLLINCFCRALFPF